MSDFDALENRLTRAAEEVRQASRTVTPPPAPGTRPRAVPAAKGWLVFAGAFALVALAIGVLPLFDRGTGAPVASPSTTVPVEPPSTDAPVAECSATGVPAPGAQEGLPENVAAKRQAIIDAAVACDFGALEALAPENFITHFGGGRFDQLVEWENDGEGKLGILLQILGMSHGVQETGDGATYYVRPGAFAADTWDDITDEQMAEIRQLHTQQELDDMRQHFDGYAGWRTGIRADGTWHYFVAGD